MEISDSDEKSVRMDKLARLRKMCNIPYKGSFNKTHFTSDVRDFDQSGFRDGAVVIKKPSEKVSVAGRVMTKRDHGGLTFLDIKDMDGDLQIALNEEVLKKDMEFLREFIDLGDFIGVVGEPFITKRGTLAVSAKNFELLSKAIRPFPTKHFGIEDIETRYRKRYLDILLNDDVSNRLRVRSKVVESLRQSLIKNKFVEVVTRTIQPTAGGAMAKTFKTHHDALNYDFNLRISNELDLKMAVAGGIERVFEFAIDFRNEGIDSSHLQEFQILEWYLSYENYEKGIQISTEILRKAIEDSLGTTTFKILDKDGKEHEISFEDKIPRITFRDLLKKHDIDVDEDIKELQKIANGLGIESVEKRSKGNLLDDIYKKIVRPKLINPIYIVDYPAEMFPLARRKDEDENIAEAYQLIIGSWEIVKGYSELVDPIEQRRTFEEQEKERDRGDSEAMEINKEFLCAMEHGIPPVTGFGMGIDRFVALITGAQNLRESVLFPLLLPKDDEYE